MRVVGWSDRFVGFLNEAESKRFRWGHWDCCIFGARNVAILTGRDPRSIFPQYRTKGKALAIIAECGGIEGLMRRALGEPMPNKAFSQRGDIVLCNFGRGLQPAVCTGQNCVAPGRFGLERHPIESAVLAWTV